MRLIRLLVALLCVALGVAVGTLNPQPVTLDLAFAALPSTLGVSLLVAMLLGAIAGGTMLTASVILPLQQQLRRARRQSAVPSAAAPAAATPVAPDFRSES
jgi:putative membrane protein